jgi:hypothetical protein
MHPFLDLEYAVLDRLDVGSLPLQLRHQEESSMVNLTLASEFSKILMCDQDCLAGLKVKGTLWRNCSLLLTRRTDRHRSKLLNESQ